MPAVLLEVDDLDTKSCIEAVALEAWTGHQQSPHSRRQSPLL